MPAPLASVTREHERLVHAVARPVGLDQPAVVHHAVDHRRGELVVAEDRAPLPELDVGRDDEAPPLVAVQHHLEEQPRPGDVDRDVAELVQDHEVGVGGLGCLARGCGRGLGGLEVGACLGQRLVGSGLCGLGVLEPCVGCVERLLRLGERGLGGLASGLGVGCYIGGLVGLGLGVRGLRDGGVGGCLRLVVGSLGARERGLGRVGGGLGSGQRRGLGLGVGGSGVGNGLGLGGRAGLGLGVLGRRVGCGLGLGERGLGVREGRGSGVGCGLGCVVGLLRLV